MNVKDKIQTIRGLPVMLDSDLAELYEVETRVLNQAVKRNQKRFPPDFYFQLNEFEQKNLISQSVTSRWGGTRKNRFVFTEHGVAALSGVLQSKKAIEVNIQIIRAFIKMRKMLLSKNNLPLKIQQIDQKLLEHDTNFERLFKSLELNRPNTNQGIFFDGQFFDSYKFIIELIQKAKTEIILIDNYIDENTITLFTHKKENVKVMLYTKDISNKLELAIQKFNEQYGNLDVKEFTKSHDRFLIIDEQVYHIGASLKDLGKKWFAFSKMNIAKKTILDKI